MVPDASSRRPKDFEIGLRAAYVATLAPTSDFWSSVVTSKRVPAGDQPAEFHAVAAESISVADIVRGPLKSATLSEESTMPSRIPAGAISPEKLYPLTIAMTHLGWSQQTVQRARKNGLVSYQFGRHLYVPGAELIRVITKSGRKRS